MIGGTSEAYLTPSLAKIADFFKMSENLAGVTFLAFGNGAADVVSSIVAAGLGDDGIYMSASGLIGSCTVNNFFLGPLVVLLSKKQIQMPKDTYARDNIFLLCTQCLLLSYFIFGSIYWAMALVLPILYTVYVFVCFYQERAKNKIAEAEKAAEMDKEAALFEQDLAHSQTKAEAVGDEIVRKEGESFVKYTSIDTSSFIESHVEEPEKHDKKHVIKVSSAMARQIKNRLWKYASSVADKLYFDWK